MKWDGVINSKQTDSVYEDFLKNSLLSMTNFLKNLWFFLER